MTSVPAAAGRQSVSLAEVAQRFWWPVYGEIRDRGSAPAAAARLTGGVLGRLSNGSPFLRHEAHDGRLRLLMFAELAAGLANPEKLAGGGREGGVDLATAEARAEYGPAAPGAAGFRRRWATTVMELALSALRAAAAQSGGTARSERLVPFLARNIPDWHQTDIAEAVDMAEMNNLRDEFRRHVRRVVGETVTTPMALDAELLELFG